MPRQSLQTAERSMNHAHLLAVARTLAECLVCHPTDLRLEIAESERQVVVTINGHRDDIGKLMGKECRNVKAIQALIAVLTERESKSARVNIAEGWTGAKGETRPTQSELFCNAAIRRLDTVAKLLFDQHSIRKSATSTHTTLTVRTSNTPRMEIEPCLQTVFKAFGGMNNHFITIEVIKGVPDERQAA